MPQVNEKIWNAFVEIIHFESAEANEVLLEYGEDETRVRYLLSGFVKAEHHQDNRSYVYTFRDTNEICSSTLSFFSDSPNLFTLTAVVPTEYLYVEKADLYKVLAKIPGVDKLLLGYSNAHLQSVYGHLAEQRMYTAEERFARFAQKYPEILKYAKRKDIASLLNIAPQTLSKIMHKNYHS